MALYLNGNKIVNSLVVDGKNGEFKLAISPDFTQQIDNNGYVTNTSALGIIPATSEQIPEGIELDMTKSWSYKIRFKCNSFLNRAMILLGVGKSVGEYSVSPLLQINANGAGLWAGMATVGASTWTHQLNLSTTLSADTWYYIELKWDTTTVSLTLYSDNMTQISTDSASATQIKCQFPMCFGSVGNSSSYVSNVVTFDLDNSSIINNGVEIWKKSTGGNNVSAIYTIDQSQGGVWINTGIIASDYNEFLFVFADTTVPNDNLMRQIPTANIAVYTGGQDVYTNIFNATTIVVNFNVRIYNNELYISFNGTGSNTRKVMICMPSIIIN